MNHMYINTLMKKPLSGQEVINLTGNPNTNLLSYVDLHKIKSLDELLGKTRSCIILYEWKQNFGHWICCFEDPLGRIEVYDSYGIYKPDDELDMIPLHFAKMTRQNYPYLTKLLYDSGKEIEYNNRKRQGKGDGIATCGRYAGVRLYFKNMTLDSFDKLFKYNKQYTPDELITILSELISTGNI